MSFPQNFVWGAAAASYQIEGAAHLDGKGPSVWDMLCRKQGAILNGDTGDVACDHYHRYAEDVALMRQIGLQAYRLSISWPRVLPTGTGSVNSAGLAFYDRLIDALLAAGIQPWVTLFHWDFPLALYHRGGWLNRDSADWFAEYTHVIVDKLSDRVKHWMTLNEPQVYINAGHLEGRHAPGDILAFGEVLRAGHNTLRAHGKSVQAIRAATRQPCRIGYAPASHPKVPFTETPADIEAAHRAFFATEGKHVATMSWWLDPVFFGEYPADAWRYFGADVPHLEAGDLETIAQPVDFFGINIYAGDQIRAGADGRPEKVPFPVGHPLTGFDWPVVPSAMQWTARFCYERYQKPIVVTENGLSCRDWISLDGKCHDPQRIDFIRRYLLELEKAIAAGVDIEGYFHWSFIDNFEWAQGYRQRFGLIHCDYPTGTRTPKDSAAFYAEVIRTHGAALHQF
jgi:beta-glucosidase